MKNRLAGRSSGSGDFFEKSCVRVCDFILAIREPFFYNQAKKTCDVFGLSGTFQALKMEKERE